MVLWKLTLTAAAEVISKKQKIRFLLGIFDGNDNRLFDRGEFTRMMKAFYHGTAAMFHGGEGIQEAAQKSSHLWQVVQVVLGLFHSIYEETYRDTYVSMCLCVYIYIYIAYIYIYIRIHV